MAVKFKERCKKCFHFQVCANVLQNDLFIREVMLGDKEPECKQFVEVVRCKDCKYGNNFCARGKRKSTYCQRLGKQPVRMEQDDFCSCGERREGE